MPRSSQGEPTAATVRYLIHRMGKQGELATEEGKALIAKSKFKDLPFFAKAKKGKIVLQDHGDPVWFRNMKIRGL